MTFRRALLLTILLTGVGVLLVMVSWQVLTEPAPGESGASAPVATSIGMPAPPRLQERRDAVASALEALGEWDDRRADAWARGDTAALARLYVRGSRAGAVDRRLLESYVARGLVVEGMRTQVLSAEVRVEEEQRWVIVVTDRLASAVAVGGGRRLPLPRDRPSRHTVELVRQGGDWLVAEVR